MGKAPSELTESEKQKIGVTLAESGFSGYLKVKDIVPVMAAMYPDFDTGKIPEPVPQIQYPAGQVYQRILNRDEGKAESSCGSYP